MKKAITLSIVIVAVIGITIYTQNRESSSPEDMQVKEWVQLTEKKDTASQSSCIAL